VLELDRQDLAGRHVVAVGEAAGDDEDLVTLEQLGVFAQAVDVDFLGHGAGLLKRKLRFVVAIAAGGAQDQDVWRVHAGILAAPSYAGRVGGPGNDVFTVQSYQSVSYYITFEGGKVAEVAIVGDGRTDLDLFVYDASGTLVRQGIGPTDIEALNWVPNSTQT